MEEKQNVSYSHSHQSIISILFTTVWFIMQGGGGEKEKVKEDVTYCAAINIILNLLVLDAHLGWPFLLCPHNVLG